MQYVDTVYGSTSFTEPTILDLIQSDDIERLRGVLQHGITAVLGITQPITRFEHSVGAMILVQRAAALMHDVSHTAFSHVADFVFGGPKSYHEEKRREWMAQSEIPADFLHDERFHDSNSHLHACARIAWTIFCGTRWLWDSRRPKRSSSTKAL
jgi:uncharacterized protein